MNRKKIAGVICVLLVFTLLLSLVLTAFGSAQAVTQSQIDALKNQQEAINQQKNEIKDKLTDLQSQMTSAVEKKTYLDEQNELARQEIELINEQIDLYEKLIEKKAAELEEAKKVEEAQKEALRVRMRAMEENGKLSYFSVLFKASSFTDFLSLLNDITMVMEYDKKLEDQYIAARQHVEEVKAEYEATKQENEDKKVELEAKKKELEIQIDNAVEVINGLDSDIAEYQKQFDANASQEQAIRNQIDTLIAELERQQQQQQGGNITSGTGSFLWPTPSSYYVSSPYGYRTHPIFGDQRFHSGVDIGAAHGAQILAADSGTVVTAVYSSSYGNYVVISHGNGNSTLYAHMSSMAVSAGQTVNKGDVIGYVGSTGWSTGAHLHFEIKLGGVLTDPMSQF